MGTPGQLQSVPRTNAAQSPASPTKSLDVDAINKMSTTDLVNAIGYDPTIASRVIRTRPSIAGELMQVAINAARPETAVTIAMSIRYDFQRALGTGAAAHLLLRSVLRLTGPGSEDVRAAMRAVITELHDQEATTDPFHRSWAAIDGLDQTMDAAMRDPEGGKFVANFYDRPDDAAAQLVEEAGVDPAAMKRRSALLSSLMAGAPAAARFFVHALMRLDGPDAIQAKRWVLVQLDGAMRPDIHMMQTGYNDMIDGGPQVRAERLVPLLAELVSEPEVALDLVGIARGVARDVPDWMPSLAALLRTVLDASWSKAIQGQVRGAIRNNAATMFQNSLLGDDKLRTSDSGNSARFIAEVAQAEADVGVERSMVKAVGEMLEALSRVLPSGAKKVVDVTGSIMASAGKDGSAEWNRAALDLLLRQVYERVHPRPEQHDGTLEIRDYNAAFFDWAAGPDAQYTGELQMETKR